ncbi:hypothetical protein HBA55_32970 [Pseudomaricurvus alkylphenolicus]|uniref:hypothetical protein n=1 Tax=Pseudomaricurvus alkylphenolicus TaxID=1306991 RepID=UPI00141DCFB8|nr:hypothetical protein [Pseudomaricurvus alkylphenolicus]NIB44447.1 hypothetical protein [Pseudomaricurvus alkylphenolicus]
MNAIKEIASRFSSSYCQQDCRENNREFVVSFSLGNLKLPIEEELLHALRMLPERDNCELILTLENQDDIHLLHSDGELSGSLSELQTAIELKNADESCTLTVQVTKHSANRLSSIYNLECMSQFWQSGSVVDAIERYSLASADVDCFEVLDIDEPFTVGNVLFRPQHSQIEHKFCVSAAERQVLIQKRDEICHFANAASVHCLPNDFVVSGTCSLDSVVGLFNQLRKITSLVYICDFSKFDVNGDIHLRMNGYRLYSCDIRREDGFSAIISEDYFRIYQWIYDTGNSIDKAGLARNVVTLHILNEDLLQLESDTLTSIESGFQIYLKENVKQYIEIKNKLSEFIQLSSDKAANIVSSFGMHLKNSTWTMYSFFASIFLIRLLSNKQGSLVSNEVFASFFVFALIALFMMLFARWELHKEKERFVIAYEAIKERYKDLLSKNDLEKILAHDKQHVSDIQYINTKSKWLTTVWIAVLVVLFLFVFGFWSIGANNQSVIVNDISVNEGTAQPTGSEVSSLQKRIASLVHDVEKIKGSVDSLGQVEAEGGFSEWWILLVLITAVVIGIVIIRLSSKKDPLLLWTQRSLAVLSVATAFVSLLIMIDTQWHWFSDKPAPVLAVFKVDDKDNIVETMPLLLVNSTDNDSSSSTQPVANFMIPFEEASCSDSQDRLQWDGVKTTPRFESFIRRLGKNIASCASDIHPVVIQVKGFSSSSEVNNFQQCNHAKNSDEANLIIANARRDRVVQLLSAQAGPWVDVQPHNWDNGVEGMVANRQFNDRIDDQRYSSSRGMFNRRVEVAFLEIGRCTVPDVRSIPITVSDKSVAAGS